MYDGVKDMLFLIDYLVQNSSPEHKVSEAELMMALFRYKNPNDIRSNKVYNTSIGKAGIYENSKKHSKKISRLQFEYCMYDYDENRKKITLVTRPVKKNGEITNIREVNPLILTWSNGYYYLVTYACFNDEYHYYNYRVDRMKNVKCLKQDADEYNDRTYFRSGEFDPKLYIAKHPVMYSSTKIYDKVEIRCKRFILNNALDTFGFDIKVLKCEGNEVVFTVNNLTGQGVLMWALEYCEHCEILNPPELRAEMKRYAELMVKKYEE